jgi:carboxymethylenebutenolidase
VSSARTACTEGVAIEKIAVMSGKVEVPEEVAIPGRKGPFPRVLYIHAKRGKDIAVIANDAGHMQNPDAAEPEQLFSVAPEVAHANTPMLFLIGEQDYELRRMNGGCAFYNLYELGVPVEMQYYPLARRAFDFRNDHTPEERIATRDARERVKNLLREYLKVNKDGRST